MKKLKKKPLSILALTLLFTILHGLLFMPTKILGIFGWVLFLVSHLTVPLVIVSCVVFGIRIIGTYHDNRPMAVTKEIILGLLLVFNILTLVLNYAKWQAFF